MLESPLLKWRWIVEEYCLRERQAQGLSLFRKLKDWFVRRPRRVLGAVRYALLELRWVLNGNVGLVWKRRALIRRQLLTLLALRLGLIADAVPAHLTNLRRRFYRLMTLQSTADDEISLLRDGFTPGSMQKAVGYRPQAGSVFYLAYNSLPYHLSGYAARTHELAVGLRNLGYDERVVTRLGYPRLFPEYRGETVPPEMEVAGVPYHRLPHDQGLLSSSTQKQIELNIAAVIELAREHRPAILHAGSNFLTGLTAVYAARKLGIPSIYGVRGLWEVTRLSRKPNFETTLHFAQAVRLETDACMKADRVIAITGAIKNELVRRGVPAGKITVVPNGVDTRRFQVRPRDRALASEFDIAESDVVVGYVGSMVDYEGLDDLLRAVRGCVDRGIKNVRVLLVGHGPVVDQCFDLAQSLKIDDRVIFIGRVPYNEVESYYSLIDIAPFPRKSLPVCEMVSPLKPFEAMAMGKCVIVSSVAALQEIVGNRDIGLVYDKGDVDSLSRCLERAIVDQSLRQRLGSNARDFVVAERDWAVLAERVADLYRQLGAATGPVPAEVARSQVPSMV